LKLSELADRLGLQPHPEGGYFRETYRSPGLIPEDSLQAGVVGPRNYCTGIYFLLTEGNFSAFHRVKQDEMWHFYLGSPIELFEITPKGDLKRTLIGSNLVEGHLPQYLVPGGHWFASRVLHGSGEYSLAGCTVAPGFDFRDFEMADRMELIRDFPDHQDLITELTR
jgi:predicted cupin superfamily sugar epimerase